MPWNKIPDSDQYFSRLKRDDPDAMVALAKKAGRISAKKDNNHRASLVLAREARAAKRIETAAALAESQNGGA